MKINLKATELDLTPALREYIERKIDSLSRFLKRWDAEGAVEIWVEVARTTRHHHKGNVFRAEADLRLPGKVLRAEDEDRDIRTAIDRIKDKLKREIEKYKELKGLKEIQ